MEVPLKISEISKIVGLECSTLRYYEQIELIRNIKKNNLGQRDYSEEDLAWVKFVVAMKKAGLSINDIKKFGELYYSQNEDFNDRLKVALECRQKLVDERELIDSGIRFLDKKVNFYKMRIEEDENE